MQHPSIKAAGVVGVPDERLGEEIAACIILKDGVEKPSVEDIRNFCKVESLNGCISCTINLA